jgi:hypothetical protein
VMPPFGAPTARRFPSSESDTDLPNLSPAAAPRMADPRGVQFVMLKANTRTRPLLLSKVGSPMASRLPSADSDTDVPDSSLALSPGMARPRSTHATPFHRKDRVTPLLAMRQLGHPTTRNRDPNSGTARETDAPNVLSSSAGKIVSMSAPSCTHAAPPSNLYTFTWDLIDSGLPTATNTSSVLVSESDTERPSSPPNVVP